MDIIGDVVTAMKPALDLSGVVVDTNTVTITATAPVRNALCEGHKVKLVSNTGAVVYGEVTTIASETVIVTATGHGMTAETLASASVVLNYHYGHRLEIVNIFKEWTRKDTVKKEQFPAICLFHDFEERVSNNGYERECDLNLVIMTDTKPTFTAADRYTYSFDPVLYPLYELFMERLAESSEIAEVYPEHTKIDRLYWGKTGLYGNTGNIFNDYIDAIEIDNLKIKTLKSC